MKKPEIKYDLTIITVVDGKNEEYTMKTYNDLDTLVNDIDEFVDVIRITSEIRKEENTGIHITNKEKIEMEDLIQAVINYLYEKVTNKHFITDNDVQLLEIIYKV